MFANALTTGAMNTTYVTPGMTEAEAQELADRINGGCLQPPEKTKGGLAEAVKIARGR